MVEITNFEWGDVSIFGLIFGALFVVASVYLVIFVLVALPLLDEDGKLPKTAKKALVIPCFCSLTIFAVATLIIGFDSDEDKGPIDYLAEDFYDAYDVSLHEETTDGVEEFHTSDWKDELRDFLDGETEHRTYVLAREEGRPDTEAVLLFERDDTESDDFTVSLAIPQKGDKDVEFLDYNTGEPINEGKTTNTDEEETD